MRSVRPTMWRNNTGTVNRHINPFANNTWFLRVCSTSLLKTLWEKEKMLVTSNFSFSHSFSTSLENIPPFLSNLKLSSVNSFNLEEFNICLLKVPISFFQLENLFKRILLKNTKGKVSPSLIYTKWLRLLPSLRQGLRLREKKKMPVTRIFSFHHTVSCYATFIFVL